MDYYAQLRSERAAERADVAIVVCDADEGLTSEDLRVADVAMQNNCATVIALNKWDVTRTDLEDAKARVTQKLRQRPPVLAVSAKSGRGLARLVAAALERADRSQEQIQTAQLNRFLSDLQTAKQPPAKRGRRLKMYYMAQFQTGAAALRGAGERPGARHALLRVLPREPAARALEARRRAAGDRLQGQGPRLTAAVVFDLDGVLLESEQVWNEAKEALVRERGGRWSERAPRDMMGMSSPEWSRYVRDELGVDLDPEEISADVVARLERIYRERLPWIEGAREAVERLGGALAARARLVLEPGDHRPLPRAVRARGPVRGDRLLRGGGARKARPGRVPGGGQAARGARRRTAPRWRTPRTASGPPRRPACA